MRIAIKDKQKLLRVALGKEPADLIITNARLVNVITGEIYPANVFVADTMIAHIETSDFSAYVSEAKHVIDARGQYLIPGLIDAHMHIESSMLTPRNFAKAVIGHGTTTIVTDPHEIANVYGVKGVEYMHDCAQDLPMRQLINIPSCVPSVPSIEQAGADMDVNEIAKLIGKERIIGLAEVMDFVAVCHGDERMMAIIELAQKHNLYVQGHAPYVNGRMLSAYLCGGPYTDHESTTAEDALEKLRNGMVVDARESSVAKDVAAVWRGVSQSRYLDTVCLCTDDREAEDILSEGHINHVVNQIIGAGMDPIDAIRSATFNTAREIRCDNLGAIAPGYVADMLLVDRLDEIHPNSVFFEGKLVAENGKVVVDIPDRKDPIEQKNSVTIKAITTDDLTIFAPTASTEALINLLVIDGVDFTVTTAAQQSVPIKDGKVTLSDPDLKFVAVLNRHPGSDNIALGVVRGYGIQRGAVASTVAHDSHNCIVIYDTPANGLAAVNELIRVGGGMCAVDEEKVIYTLPLPVAGLMSLKEADELALDNIQLKETIRSLGMEGVANPLLRIVFLALVVIPEVRISDVGLVDVRTQQIIPLFVQHSNVKHNEFI